MTPTRLLGYGLSRFGHQSTQTRSRPGISPGVGPVAGLCRYAMPLPAVECLDLMWRSRHPMQLAATKMMAPPIQVQISGTPPLAYRVQSRCSSFGCPRSLRHLTAAGDQYLGSGNDGELPTEALGQPALVRASNRGGVRHDAPPQKVDVDQRRCEHRQAVSRGRNNGASAAEQKCCNDDRQGSVLKPALDRNGDPLG